MAEYMNKEVFLSSMGLTGDETKYGNRDAEHQHRSYSTYMSYEIVDSVEDSIVEEELAPVRHGTWNGEGDGYADGEIVIDVWYCSECGYCIDDGTDDQYFPPNYCPNCGAKMDAHQKGGI